MKSLVDFLLWAGVKEVVAKALLTFLGLIFVVAPLITGAYNIYHQFISIEEKMDMIILQQHLQTVVNGDMNEKIDQLQDTQYIYQNQSVGDIESISKTIERSNIGMIEIIKTFHKKPINIPLIEHQEREIQVFMTDNLPHKKEKKGRIIAVPNPSLKQD